MSACVPQVIVESNCGSGHGNVDDRLEDIATLARIVSLGICEQRAEVSQPLNSKLELPLAAIQKR
jgi:hypothetical protein